MERYTIKQLPSEFWSVWDGDIWLNAALPSREAAEKLAKAFKSSAEEPFDLPAFLLGEVYGSMSAEDISAWSAEEAEAIAHDLSLRGIEADATEIYEIVAEFIAQDADEL